MVGVGKEVNENTQEIIENPRKAQLLTRLLQSRSLLTLEIAGLEGKFSSAFVSFDTKNETIDLDQPFPSGASAYLPNTKTAVKPGTVLAVTGSIKGTPLKFETTLKEIRLTPTTPIYACSLPETILYQQQRDQFRLELGAATRSRASVLLEGKLHSGRIVDLSGDGTCFRLRQGVAIEAGDVLTSVKLQLDDSFIIKPTLRVLSVYSVVQAPGMIQIGTQFDKISQNERATLRVFIRELERRKLRNSR